MKNARQLREERRVLQETKRRKRQAMARGADPAKEEETRNRVRVNAKALVPNNSWSEPDFVTRGFYIDRPFTCRDCGKEEVWTATQQKWWYEVAKGEVFTAARRCRPCRRKQREYKEAQCLALRKALALRPEGAGIDPAIKAMIPVTEHDDPRFITQVRKLLAGSLRKGPPQEVYVIRIDGWFGRAWRNFSGKVLGAFGVWENLTTVPPFHPHRVVEESHWSLKDGPGWERTPAPPLHIEQRSEENTRRRIAALAPSAVFFWYGSGSATAHRVSAMLYRTRGGEVHTWFVSLRKNLDWKITEQRGISSAELKMLLE